MLYAEEASITVRMFQELIVDLKRALEVSDLIEMGGSKMHTPTNINKIVALLANKAKEIACDKLVKVILYGSYARGDYEEWSDIDVMVLVNGDDHTTKLFEQELWEYCNDLELNYDVVLSVIVKDYNHFQNWKNVLPFYANVQNEGVVVNA